ncbi:hypothetical protein G7Y89_g10442 [Cudoniella acicularis]|uniref:Peptidase S8/S53 domain-containing protein n=1 Tax=Cudoniella acicularis TaxID=354080 RepID=A0A8H4RCQ9_9HELO|nr:hypothetical protein G7Y89_g10442 [Cudoniella acicularis]
MAQANNDTQPTDLALLWRNAVKAYNEKVGNMPNTKKLSGKHTDLVMDINGVYNAVDSASESFKKWRHPDGSKVDKVRSIIHENLEHVQWVGDRVVESATAAFPPAGAIWTVVTYAIEACQMMSRDYDQLLTLIGETGSFIKTLQIIEQRVPNCEPYVNIVLEALTALMKVFAIQTRFMYDKRALRFWHSLTSGADSELQMAYGEVAAAISLLGNANGFQTVRNTEDIKILITSNGEKIDDYYESIVQHFQHQDKTLQTGLRRQEEAMRQEFKELRKLFAPSGEFHQQLQPVQTQGQTIGGGFKGDKEKNRQRSSLWLRAIDEINAQLRFESMHSDRNFRARVAILDTGYNPGVLNSHTHGNRPPRWEDFAESSKEPQDLTGHGTYMVSLFMRIAPHADICVARIAKTPEDIPEATYKIAHAIDFASEHWDVDIILMSFGYDQGAPEISRAIRRAVDRHDERILFFAGTGINGVNQNLTFPASHELVIPIRVTDADGTVESFSPPRTQDEGIVYGTLGLEVPSAFLEHDPEAQVYASGPIAASPIATGLAAMFLGYATGYVKQKKGNGAFPDVLGKLRTKRGMLAMFKSMATQRLNMAYVCVTPWNFGGIDDETRWAKIVAAMADVS